MATIIVLAIIALGCYIYYLSNGNHEETQKQSETPSHPAHFDLLDENGNPITKPKVKVVVGGCDSDAPVQELQYFCIKDKGYHVSVWPKDSNNWLPGLDYVEFNIAGMSHQDNIDNYLGEHVGKLMPEPTNPFDANAIKILAKDGHQVGYVPKDMTSSVRKFTNLPCKCYFYIGENDGTYFSSCYVTK